MKISDASHGDLKDFASRLRGAMAATRKLEEAEDDLDDVVLGSAPVRPLVTLPPEVCKGLSSEHFTAERKSFIRKMLANDVSTLFDHQRELLEFVKEHGCKPFVVSYEACIGAGKTAATLALAGSLQCKKLLYACPSEQQTVRLELAQMFYSATATSSDVHFVFADLVQGHLVMKYSEHAMRSLTRNKDAEVANPIDCHSIILASSDAAARILLENQNTPFLLFLDEFMTSAGCRESIPFQSNMRLISVMLQRSMPQVILSSAMSMGGQAWDLFKNKGFVTKTIQSTKHWTAWEMFASPCQQWHVHRGCKTRGHIKALEAAMEQPLFARMVSSPSVMDLDKVLPDCAEPADHLGELDVIHKYRSSLKALCQEEEEVIEEICKQEALGAHSLRSGLQCWVEAAGKTTVLLAVSQVDAAIGLFRSDLEHVHSKVMGVDHDGGFSQKLQKVNMSKLFRSCFFRKEPFHAVWTDLAVEVANERHRNLAILLTAGIGVFTESLNQEWRAYASFVAERAKGGHLHLLIADASIAHGVNFAISRVVVTKSLVEEQPASTVFQLMGRAGRRGLSNEAKVLTCELWRQTLMCSLHHGHDLFEVDSRNVHEALESRGALECAQVTGEEENLPKVGNQHSVEVGDEDSVNHVPWWRSFVDCMMEGLCACCSNRKSS